MAAGVTQSAPGQTIFVYDDTHADAGGDGSYSFTDIYNAMQILSPGNVDMLDVTSNARRKFAFNVRLQIGDSGTGTATTTLTDTNVDVDFADNTVLQYRTTQVSSWFTNLGTKVGSGNRAGAKNGCQINIGAGLVITYRGTLKFYDCKFVHNGTSSTTFTPVDSSGSEMVECTLLNTSTGNFALGATSNRFDNLFNVEVCGTPTVALISAIGSLAQERITISATAPTAYVVTAVTALQFKDFAFKGTPSASDFRWTNVAATNWVVVQPKWSGNAAKFSQAAAGSMAVANGAKEYWLFNVKVVGSTGTAIANIPVTLTDTLGNAQVSTTTDANGRISFGSALTANTVIVMDHYTVSQVYTQRHRSPFLLEVNTGNTRNTDYQSLRTRFLWPGYEGVGLSSGTFEDVNAIIPLQTASGSLTSWIEREQP